jgi:hypothetical protein
MLKQNTASYMFCQVADRIRIEAKNNIEDGCFHRATYNPSHLTLFVESGNVFTTCSLQGLLFSNPIFDRVS